MNEGSWIHGGWCHRQGAGKPAPTASRMGINLLRTRIASTVHLMGPFEWPARFVIIICLPVLDTLQAQVPCGERQQRPVHSEIAGEISSQNAVLNHSGRSHISDCLPIQPALLSRGTWCVWSLSQRPAVSNSRWGRGVSLCSFPYTKHWDLIALWTTWPWGSVRIRRHWKQGLLRCHLSDGQSAPFRTSERVYPFALGDEFSAGTHGVPAELPNDAKL